MKSNLFRGRPLRRLELELDVGEVGRSLLDGKRYKGRKICKLHKIADYSSVLYNA